MSRSSPPPPYQELPSSTVSTLLDTTLPTLASHIETDPSSQNTMAESGPSRALARRSSLTSSSSFSPTSAYPTPDMSTAPTTPQSSTTPLQRAWRPTSNVPAGLHHRHRRAAPVGSAGDDQNRWLSEDEGAETEVRTRGIRRRRTRGSIYDLDLTDRGGEAGPSTQAHRAQTPKITTTDEAMAAVRAAKSPSLSPLTRPRPIRARSFEPRVASSSRPLSSPIDASVAPHVGADPPRIQDIVAMPSSEAYVGLGIQSLSQGPIPDIPAAQLSRARMAQAHPLVSGSVPDFARGRGGDGIGGLNVPALATPEDLEVAAQRIERRKEMLQKLRRILGCALCPPVEGVTPPLHHPVTLPCGHTLSSRHISIPAPPPIQVVSNVSHELHAAQQRQHQQRLNLWAGVMCPIPTCKRYSPNASASAVLSEVVELEVGPPDETVSSGAQRGEMMASGVTYYPPPPPNAGPPAYSSQSLPNGNGSPLLDISVQRILQLVQRELHADRASEMDDGDHTDVSEASDDEEVPVASSSSLTRDFSHLGSSSMPRPRPDDALSPMARTSSKRRRHGMGPVTRIRPATSSATDWPFEKELIGYLECDVCALLLYEPVTTPCQHSFCSKCLSRSLDHSSRCPVCRQDLPSFAFFQDHAVNKVLLTIIKTAFPEEYADRQQAIERDERDSRLDTPIFVCTLAFPGMPTILHVFEPRYRLMIRRCIESTSPRFGMVLPERGTGAPHLQGVMEYGTMLEIQSVQMLPDGRSMVETVGTHRFKLKEKGNLDGYTVGRIERIDDVSPEEEIAMEREAVAARAASTAAASAAPSALPSTVTVGASAPAPPPIPTPMPTINAGSVDFGSLASQAAATASTSVEDTPETTEELMAICCAFIDQLRSGSAPWLLQRLNNTYGTMPTDPSEFSYWMALVMPIDEYEKARLLPIRSPRLRLKLIVHWVESLRSSWWFSSGCVVG